MEIVCNKVDYKSKMMHVEDNTLIFPSIKRDEMKASRSAFSTRPKASLMPGVTRCTNAHSCWSDLYSPA